MVSCTLDASYRKDPGKLPQSTWPDTARRRWPSPCCPPMGA